MKLQTRIITEIGFNEQERIIQMDKTTDKNDHRQNKQPVSQGHSSIIIVIIIFILFL
jgi:hypothetical protein